MRKSSRALREARQLLATARVTRAPVDIYKLASHHAVVLEIQMEDSISGMLIPLSHARAQKPWAILVNAGHAEVRKRFTVAHELGHILLHDFKSPHADTGGFKIRMRAKAEYDTSIADEIEANQFAAEVLMPTRIMIARIAGLDIEYVPSPSSTNDAIASLAQEFKVSQQALQIRLSDFI